MDDVGRKGFVAFALSAPVLALLVVTFLIPLAMVFWTSVSDRELQAALPRVAPSLRAWNGTDPLPAGLTNLLAEDLRAAAPESLAALGRRLSYEDPKLNSVVRVTANRLKTGAETPEAINGRWAEIPTWQTLKRAAGPTSSFYLLAAFDLRWIYGEGPADIYKTGGLYRSIMARTLLIAAAVTACTLVLAFPLCLFLSRASPVVRNLSMLVIMLPFWTSIVVRTTAWIVLLQDRGVINRVLQASGLTERALPLLFNRFAVILVLTHVMLPFLALPLLASMRAIDDRLMQAAASMGSPPFHAFRRVYLPQVMPGLAAGAMLVFVLTLGFYVTPALVGGPADQTIGSYIALFTTGTANWGLASALGLVLTAFTAALLAIRHAPSWFGRFGTARS